MELTAQEIADFTAGAVLMPAHPAHRACTGLSWDSRAVAENDCYVALPGARVDGHDFCAAAIREGAACVLVQREVDAEIIDAARTGGAAVVRVASTAAAVTALAAGWRGRLEGTVVAITGSSGKTTTKGLVAAVLAEAGTVVATLGNQNNELGVPATLLRAQPETASVVVEMGMRGLGQLAELCAFVRPHVALVTNVGTSHIELLGSRKNIARAKAEPLFAVDAGGFCIVPADDDYTRELVEFSQAERHGANVVLYAGDDTHAGAHVFATAVQVDGAGCATFTLHTPDGAARVSLRVPGLHNVHNACAAAAVGYTQGLSPEAIAHALEGARSQAGRNNVVAAPGGFTVVDDCYNANPDSMKASLSTFASMQVEGPRIAVLGDMGELGGYSAQGHAEAGQLAAHCGLDRLVCVGPLARGIAAAAAEEGLPERGITCVADAAEALQALGRVPAGAAVLVKASHSVGLERVVKGLVG